MRSATVIGAGVFGAWIARALTDRGWKVSLVDQHGPANSRASSGGETRIIRSGYGALTTYARWARDSLAEWLALELRSGETLFVRTGALFVSRAPRWLEETAATLSAENIPHTWLDPEALRIRYPQCDFRDAAGAVLEAGAGVLFARRAVQTLVRTLEQDGVPIVRRVVDPETEIRDSSADALVFACGPWLPQLFPQILGEIIVPTRQEVFFFGAPAADDRFSPSALPAWVAFDEGIYGLPDLEHRGVKIAIDEHGPAVDPERMNRIVDSSAVERIRGLLRRRLPALGDAPLIETRVCQYENSPDGHFILDRLPGFDHVWIAGGGSGHGFKHGPAIGNYIAGVMDEEREPDAMFALDGRPPRQRRVY